MQRYSGSVELGFLSVCWTVESPLEVTVVVQKRTARVMLHSSVGSRTSHTMSGRFDHQLSRGLPSECIDGARGKLQRTISNVGLQTVR